MSERYRECAPCAGPDCFLCSGTGFNGDALAYISDQNSQEYERERRGSWFTVSIERARVLQRMEDQFTKNPKRTPALLAAILAVENFIDRDMKLSMSSNIIPFDQIKERGRIKMSSLPVSQENGQQLTARHVSNQPYFPTESDWKMMLNWGASALKSGMLPVAIRSPEAAAIIALKGRELGIPFMVAIAHIHVINGKPSMSAEMMQAQARKNLPGLVINILKSDNTNAEIEFIRPEKGSKPYIQKFDMEDAKRAGALNKDVWKQYPAAMLWSRAISAGLRKVCPEALMGVSYTPEEMGANVDKEGNVIETTGTHVPEVSKSEPEPKPTMPQLTRMFAIAKMAQISDQELREMIKHPSSKDLTLKEYNEICEKLTQMTIEKTKTEQPKEIQHEEHPVVVSEEFKEEVQSVELPWTKYMEKEAR